MLVILIVILALNVSCPVLMSESNELISSRRIRRATTCILPPIPEHGIYTADVSPATPGESFQGLQLNVSCQPGYGISGRPDILCYKGLWSQEIPECIRLCKLDKDPSVYHQCLIQGSIEGYRDCNQYEPSGTLVRPQCNNPVYRFNGNLPFMRCLDGRWNYIAKCTPECGTVTPSGDELIAGGQLAKRGEFPWHTGIYSKTSSPYKQICGGSLVTNTVVISAAHCFYWNKPLPPSEFAVACGKLYRPFNDIVDNEANAQQSDVKDLKLPTRFQGRKTNFQDDIALVYLTKAIVYETHVRPICLDFEFAFNDRQLQSGSFGKVTGWGLTGSNGPASPILKVVELPYVNISYCISQAPLSFVGYITSDKICAGFENKSIAVCSGDSGGGLVFPDNKKGVDRYYLRGIVSTAPEGGVLCNTQSFAAFTHVQKHERFINANLYSNDEDPALASVHNVSWAQEKCLEYTWRAVGRICAQAPYLGLLGYGPDPEKTNWSDFLGIIISDRYIISSASVALIYTYSVTYKRIAIGKVVGTSARWIVHELIEVTVHPQFVRYQPGNDIAVAKTDSPMQFSNSIQPACLPVGQFADEEAQLFTKVDSETYRSVSVQKFSGEECTASLGAKYNHTIQTCYAHRDNLQESCNILSGDPVMVIGGSGGNSACVSTIIGVMSLWDGCKQIGFTRVSHYVPWIESIVW